MELKAAAIAVTPGEDEDKKGDDSDDDDDDGSFVLRPLGQAGRSILSASFSLAADRKKKGAGPSFSEARLLDAELNMDDEAKKSAETLSPSGNYSNFVSSLDAPLRRRKSVSKIDDEDPKVLSPLRRRRNVGVLGRGVLAQSIVEKDAVEVTDGDRGGSDDVIPLPTITKDSEPENNKNAAVVVDIAEVKEEAVVNTAETTKESSELDEKHFQRFQSDGNIKRAKPDDLPSEKLSSEGSQGRVSYAMRLAAVEQEPMKQLAANEALQKEVLASRTARSSTDLKQRRASAGASKGQLYGLLLELGIDDIHDDVKSVVGGDSFQDLRAFAFGLAEQESIRSLRVPKIRARKFWRRVENETSAASTLSLKPVSVLKMDQPHSSALIPTEDETISSQDRLRVLVLEEILGTERTYHGRLCTLVDCFLQPLTRFAQTQTAAKQEELRSGSSGRRGSHDQAASAMENGPPHARPPQSSDVRMLEACLGPAREVQDATWELLQALEAAIAGTNTDDSGLQEASRVDALTVSVSRVFVEHAPPSSPSLADSYLRYHLCYTEHRKALEELQQAYWFSCFVAAIEAHPFTGHTNPATNLVVEPGSSGLLVGAATSPTSRSGHLLLRDYLIEPIQRLPRYKLLLSELLKHCDASDGVAAAAGGAGSPAMVCSAVLEALNAVEAVATKLNANLKEHDQRLRVLRLHDEQHQTHRNNYDLQSLFWDRTSIAGKQNGIDFAANHMRRLMHEGTLTELDPASW